MNAAKPQPCRTHAAKLQPCRTHAVKLQPCRTHAAKLQPCRAVQSERARWGVALFALLALPLTAAAQPTGFTPLTDFAPGETYHGVPLGLYPGYQNELTSPHLAGGLHAALQIAPRDPNGVPDPAGRIVLLSIGMSNTSQESGAFQTVLTGYADRNPRLLFVNGAQGGQTAAIIQDPNAAFWTVIDQRLAAAGVTRAQVQAVWYKEADSNPTSGWPAYAQTLRDESIRIMNIIQSRYPNIRIAYVSSRIFAGYATTQLNPEPYAYESAFAMTWLIEAQMTGDPRLNYDPAHGPVRSPFLQWAAYLWADGTVPRRDGLTWVREDFGPDGTHPSDQGRRKVADLLLPLFTENPTARLWFVKPALQQLLGDLNGDRRISFDDINPFVLGLSDPAAFAQQYPGVDLRRAGDFNRDGRFDFDDINGFVDLLASW
ncbi:MAG: hypothetical protein AB1716_01325 [Planctomycetota bacterium]